MKRLAVVAVTCAAALSAAGAAHGATACWERVISDWSANGRVVGRYPAGCYRDAVTRLPEDLRTYSSAPQDIRSALQVRLAKTTAAAPRATKTQGAGGGNDHLLLFGLILVGAVSVAVVVIR
jgi:hypothetical protein